MSSFQFIIFATIIAACTAVTCPKAPNYNGTFIGPNCQCALGVQHLCSYSSVTLGGTSKWVRGSHVKTLCDKKIPQAKYTPIATFLGLNNAYDHSSLKQHTAVFVACHSTGLIVYDQYCDKKWGLRTIKYNGLANQNDGVSFYTFTKSA